MEFLIFMTLFYGSICFIVWVSSKDSENHREKVLDAYKETVKAYKEPKPLWSYTTTKRMRKVRRNKPKNEQAESKE